MPNSSRRVGYSTRRIIWCRLLPKQGQVHRRALVARGPRIDRPHVHEAGGRHFFDYYRCRDAMAQAVSGLRAYDGEREEHDECGTRDEPGPGQRLAFITGHQIRAAEGDGGSDEPPERGILPACAIGGEEDGQQRADTADDACHRIARRRSRE